GKIDGKGGEFTTKALALYKTAHPEAQLQQEAPADFQDPLVVDYQLREEDWKHVGPLPHDKKEQSTLKMLPYDSIEQFVAERYDADPALLAKLNAGTNLEAVKAGDAVKVPNVAPFE